MTLGYMGTLTADKDGEFFCDICKARCTRSVNGEIEYGHLVGCPDRPDEFNIGTSEGRRHRSDEGSDGGASA